ncbi:type VII secretion protein EccB [Actinacidiphila acidipaludis]|uniref:Type VII secretion protein EccB n=1 Tax=Actinacidiphila acidipaludis TaxID=2873382 RepID=A0ABS7Q2P1_9ACTN|nr:type VII secretion protein EccB [Streptomyces acidipaludis]MBY8877400.1 type VII secretion protein EccB [Streptomyces acidipaludis]
MQTRRDQVQAHRFVVSRLTSGLLRNDPDVPEGPNTRTNRALAFGGALGAVVAAGFLVFGFVSPGGSDAWKQPGTLIVEQGTGNRYLYDGTLRPVRNYASARLIAGSGLTVHTVPRSTLAPVPRGGPVGIAGAPDGLPPAARLGTGAWQVCASTRTTDSGGTAPETSLTVDGVRSGGGLGAGQALLVNGPDGTSYLLWRGNRFRLSSGTSTADALGYGTAAALPVSAAFLDAVPAGADLAPPDVPGKGTPGPALDGLATRVGQVFLVRAPGAAKQYYLLQRAGLVPVSTTQAALELAAPDERSAAYAGSAPTAVPIAADALSSALVRGGTAGPGDAAQALPQTPPALVPVDAGQAACVRLDPAAPADGDSTGTGARISLSVTPAAGLGAGTAGGAGGDTTGVQAHAAAACLPVDAVLVPPSGGALVRALGAGGGPVGTTTYLVADDGVKYLVPDAQAAGALGYDLAAARGVPAPLLAMLPTGPDLSPRDALAGRAETTGGGACTGGTGTVGSMAGGAGGS